MTTDEELLACAKAGDENAEEILLEKYKPLVRARARELFLVGGDQDDLLQEGMLGLFKAIRHYDPSEEASFATYARLLISRQMYTAIESARRQKHRALNASIPMSDLEEQQEDSLLGTAESPEAIVLDLERTQELRAAIDEALSPMERKVLDVYLQGYDYQQIAEQMGRSPKSIDNALQRIRTKAAKIVQSKERKDD